MQNLTKKQKQPPVVILEQAIFYNIFVLCLCLRIIRGSHQGAQFRNSLSQIFFNDIIHGHTAAILQKDSFQLLLFYITLATHCYYAEVRRTMGTAIVLYLLKKLLNFEICARDICEKFVYKLSESIEYVKNQPTF